MLLVARLQCNVNCKQQKFCRLSGCELFDYVTQKDYLEEQEAATYVRYILQASKYLHDNNICHLDIKVKSTCGIQALHSLYESLHVTNPQNTNYEIILFLYSPKTSCLRTQLLAR